MCRLGVQEQVLVRRKGWYARSFRTITIKEAKLRLVSYRIRLLERNDAAARFLLMQEHGIACDLEGSIRFRFSINGVRIVIVRAGNQPYVVFGYAVFIRIIIDGFPAFIYVFKLRNFLCNAFLPVQRHGLNGIADDTGRIRQIDAEVIALLVILLHKRRQFTGFHDRTAFIGSSIHAIYIDSYRVTGRGSEAETDSRLILNCRRGAILPVKCVARNPITVYLFLNRAVRV